ncbi:MAG: BLUF domain-containing protein [Pseudomonadota bacterium]
MTSPHADAHILVSLTYASRMNPDVSPADCQRILEQARDNNRRAGITGMLTFNRDYFLQTLEGPRAHINALLIKLIADRRHHDLQVIECREIKARSWARWSMNYASPTEENSAIYLKYSTTLEFNPYLLNVESARALLRDLGRRSTERQGETPGSSPVSIAG